MKREILCEPCGEDLRAAYFRQPMVGTLPMVADVHGNEHVRLQPGTLKPRPAAEHTTINCEVAATWAPEVYACDSCNADLKPGDRAVLASIWADGRNPWTPWEADYLA